MLHCTFISLSICVGSDFLSLLPPLIYSLIVEESRGQGLRVEARGQFSENQLFPLDGCQGPSSVISLGS